ncbi:putative carbohydrate-binding module family 1 protein [Botrytis fragariae]|uniref:Putative carbohydrate-binding module family 1 protein n=1 Tax=Botrytis fragariae TaxID=1964551 RepID=A0A8H6B5I3_9HELO|nr:putative carbohydrate-binding module family 1 protein [Botrytis fragariae]KAF5879357.1 putative carbohydrate-binding module family 1 protein [Botrytis fragariae]
MLLAIQASTTPILIPPSSLATTIESPTGAVRTYYQAFDSSIIELRLNFPTSSGYTRLVLIPAGAAKPDTRLAAVSWGSFDDINLYYISSAYNSTLLCEKIWNSDITG